MTKSQKAAAVIMGVTFVMFTAEAIIHYNIGVNKDVPKGHKKIVIPPAADFIRIAAVVGTFSLASTLIIRSIEKS